jgi:dCTP diphosphatase
MLAPELLAALLKFRSDRDWEQFHTPRNIASALSVEAAELLEHFVWLRENRRLRAIPDTV